MVTVVQGKVCAKNHPDRLSRLATIHQRYRQTDGRTTDRQTDFLWHRPDLTVGQKPLMCCVLVEGEQNDHKAHREVSVVSSHCQRE